MNVRALLFAAAAVLFSAEASTIDYDNVEPIPQPAAVTASEKSAVKFKPRLVIKRGCTSFPAVNEDGDISSGLPGDGGSRDCQVAPLGSQVYGRATWYNDVWAIMYAWYFPKRFNDESGDGRHDWSTAIVWIDNPAVENPKVMGLSFSTSDVNFEKTVPISFANGTTPVLEHHLPKDWPAQLKFVPNSNAGDFQDLIMWEQLPDAAYTALNSNDFYEDFNPPMNDDNFKMLLERAWPSAYWKTK